MGLGPLQIATVVARHIGVFPRAFLCEQLAVHPKTEPCTTIREQLTDWCTARQQLYALPSWWQTGLPDGELPAYTDCAAARRK